MTSRDESRPEELAPTPPDQREVTRPEDLPVVARMVVEIRSDGRRTIARGALEDVEHGERVAIEAQGTTPLSLARSLVRNMLEAPFVAALSRAPGMARSAARALLPGRRRGR